MSITTHAGQLIYNPGYPQGGAGFMDWIKKGVALGQKANNFVKDNQLISKGVGLANQFGLTDKLNDLSGGQFSNLSQMAIDQGYGRIRRRGRKPGPKPRATTGCGKRKGRKPGPKPRSTTGTGKRRRVRRS